MPEYPLDWVALLDQATAAAKDMAPLLHSYFESLIDSGFSRGEALILTSRFQTALMTPAPGEEVS